MLLLERKLGEKIVIGDNIVISLEDIRDKGERVILGITAPKHIRIDRQEIHDRNKKRKDYYGF